MSGDFQRDGKKAHKNVEVEVCVVSENGRVLDVRLRLLRVRVCVCVCVCVCACACVAADAM